MKSSIKALSRLAFLCGIAATLAWLPLGAQPASFAKTGQDINVVATIPALYALTAKVMEGTGEPMLLMQSGDSPHHFTMRPRTAQRLMAADMVICANRQSEPYLKPLLNALPERKSTLVEALAIPGLILERAPEAAHEKDALGNAYVDMHFWLNPVNAIAFTQYIAEELSALAPQHTALYTRNAAALIEALKQLDAEVKSILGSHDKKKLRARYASYHSSLRYFEKHYGIIGGKAITRTPEAGASVEEGEKLHEAVAAGALPCLLQEPEFSPRLLQDVAARHPEKTRVITVDTLGTTYPATPDLYVQMLRDIATSLSPCLGTE